jgi:hypothetical protein
LRLSPRRGNSHRTHENLGALHVHKVINEQPFGWSHGAFERSIYHALNSAGRVLLSPSLIANISGARTTRCTSSEVSEFVGPAIEGTRSFWREPFIQP